MKSVRLALLVAGLVAGLVADHQVTTEPGETGRLNDESVQFSIKQYRSVEKVYFPNLNEVVGALDLIIQNESLPGACRRSLIRLSSGMSSRETWALSCEFNLLIVVFC